MATTKPRKVKITFDSISDAARALRVTPAAIHLAFQKDFRVKQGKVTKMAKKK